MRLVVVDTIKLGSMWGRGKLWRSIDCIRIACNLHIRGGYGAAAKACDRARDHGTHLYHILGTYVGRLRARDKKAMPTSGLLSVQTLKVNTEGYFEAFNFKLKNYSLRFKCFIVCHIKVFLVYICLHDMVEKWKNYAENAQFQQQQTFSTFSQLKSNR